MGTLDQENNAEFSTGDDTPQSTVTDDDTAKQNGEQTSEPATQKGTAQAGAKMARAWRRLSDRVGAHFGHTGRRRSQSIAVQMPLPGLGHAGGVGVSDAPKDAYIVFLFLISCVLLLTVLSFLGTILVYILPDEELQSIMHLINALNVDKERSIPTWFSSMILSLSGLISASIGLIHLQLKIRRGFHWISIGIIFFYISMDESLAIHELAIRPLREIPQASGIFYMAWIIPALLILVILAIVYRRFIFDLPAITRNLLLISAAVYLGGAIGMEMVGGYYMSNNEEAVYLGGAIGMEVVGGYYMSNNKEVEFIYSVIVTVEEFMELMGISIYIYALLRHMETSRWFGIFLHRRIGRL